MNSGSVIQDLFVKAIIVKPNQIWPDIQNYCSDKRIWWNTVLRHCVVNFEGIKKNIPGRKNGPRIFSTNKSVVAHQDPFHVNLSKKKKKSFLTAIPTQQESHLISTAESVHLEFRKDRWGNTCSYFVFFCSFFF